MMQTIQAHALHIEQARPEHLDRMCAITDQAKASLKSLGIDQWQSGYPNREIWREDIRAGRAYVVVDHEDSVLGQFMYLDEADPSYAKIDGAWISDGPYACMHRVCVADSARGLGIARMMFAYCLEKARADNRVSLRIDTHEGNTPMRRALAKSSFQQCGNIHLADGLEAGAKRIAFERRV